MCFLSTQLYSHGLLPKRAPRWCQDWTDRVGAKQIGRVRRPEGVQDTGAPSAKEAAVPCPGMSTDVVD